MRREQELRALFNSPGRKARDRRENRAVSPIDPRPSGLGYQRRFPRAFLMTDMIFGIIIVTGVTIVLLGTLRHVRSAEQGLADSRSALHLAEHALLNLQHAQPLPGTSDGTRLSIHPATGGTAPAGYVWAKVDAAVHGQHRSLFGVVPASALPSPGAKS